VILDLGVCPECNLEVRGRIRLELAKLEIWRFRSAVENLISGSEWNSGSWSRFVVSFVMCVKNLRSFGRGLVGFSIGCRI